jgi:hypothetical protein
MRDKLWGKDQRVRIVKLRERLKNVLDCAADEVSLLPIAHFPDPPEIASLKPWYPPVSLVNVLTETGDTASKDEEMKFLKCKINIDAPLKTILTFIESTVKYLQELKGNPQKQRVSISTMERDMKILEKGIPPRRTKSEIAREFFPEQYERDKNSALKEVDRCLDRIKEMIKGGL